MVGTKRVAGKGMALLAAGASGMLMGIANANAASAPIVLFDDLMNQGGTVSYDGAGGALIGSDILVDTISGMNTGAKSGYMLTCDGCRLNFTTGNNVFEDAGAWRFETGGSFTITGTAKDGATTIASGDLLTGTFGSTTHAISPMSFGIVSGYLVASLDSALAAFYGVVEPGEAALSQIYLESSFDPQTLAFSGDVTDSDVDFMTSVVPVPAALPLFLTALAGVATVGYRRHHASSV